MFTAFFISLYGYNAVLSWLAWRRFAPLVTPVGTLVGCGGYVLLVAGSISTAPVVGRGDFVFSPWVLFMIPSALLLIPFGVRSVEVWFGAGRVWALSLDHIKPVRTYDLAEKAEREQNFLQAIQLYRDVYQARDPNDGVPHFRIAQLQLQLAHREESAREFQRAAELFQDAEQILVAAFRASELLADPVTYLDSVRCRISDPRLLRLLEDRLTRRTLAP